MRNDRGLVVVVVVLLIAAIAVLATRDADATATAEPIRLAEPTPETTRLRVEVAALRKEVAALWAQVDRLDRLTLTTGCVLRVWEDGSARLRDAEALTDRCRAFVAEQVGTGRRRRDLR